MKPVCIIQGPFATRSGYGNMARDIVRHVMSMDTYDVKLVSMGWGACPMNDLDPEKDAAILAAILPLPVQLPVRPELFIQISVPNEFQPQGQYNIGITAGIETTLCSAEWIDGMNRMDAIFTTSEHSKNVLAGTQLEHRDQHNNLIRTIKLEKPIEVLPNCIDLDTFKRIDKKQIPFTVQSAMKAVTENFNYLFVGHWLQGDIGEDRKNVGLMIRLFCDVFSRLTDGAKPGLILKTSGAGFSVLDRQDILRKIRAIKNSVGPSCPNVYLLHGDLTEEEMNGLYNHPKIKVHVSFTKGEGFGRPLLEATQSAKPIIASGWSGHLDFLNQDDAVLIGGEVKPIERGAVVPGMLLAESAWFNVNPQEAANALVYAFRNYGKCTDKAWSLALKARRDFSYETVESKTHFLLQQYVPKFAVFQPLTLPMLSTVE